MVKYVSLRIDVFLVLCVCFCHTPERNHRNFRRNLEMNLAFWFPAMFVLGIVAMGIVYLFFIVCEKI